MTDFDVMLLMVMVLCFAFDEDTGDKDNVSQVPVLLSDSPR
jgi:hypothetical protein